MLNNIYCIHDLKDSRKHIYIVFHKRKFWRGVKEGNLQLTVMPVILFSNKIHVELID